MAPHVQKLKKITFSLGTDPDDVNFEAQLSSWTLENNSDDGEQLWGYDGTPTREESDPDYALSLTFYGDWRADGISEYLTLNDGQIVDFVLDHHPDIATEHVKWTGQVKVKAPNVGGEVRTTESQDVTLQCIGKPAFSRVTAG